MQFETKQPGLVLIVPSRSYPSRPRAGVPGDGVTVRLLDLSSAISESCKDAKARVEASPPRIAIKKEISLANTYKVTQRQTCP